MNRLEIVDYHMEQLHDPTGILEGERYEFIIDIQVPEDDEMYTDNGLHMKLIYAVEGETGRIAQYQIFEKHTETYLPFALEKEELDKINEFCRSIVAENPLHT